MAMMSWRFLVLYFACQMLAMIFFFFCQVAILVSHEFLLTIAIFKMISYLPELVPPPESTRSLPRIPLFVSDPAIRPYSPEMIEVVELVRSATYTLLHAAALLSYTILLADEIHNASLLWVTLDATLFTIWLLRLTLNVLIHYRRLKADVKISGVPD